LRSSSTRDIDEIENSEPKNKDNFLVQKDNRIKRSSLIKKRAKNDQFSSNCHFEKTPEFKVRAKNRYPVRIATPIELFRKDRDWKHLANPSAHQLEKKLQ
jgi:hypothetical protein